MRITTLAPDDVSSALRLSTQVGWNQTAADWERLLAVTPDGCHGGWVDGTLVATTSVVAHGPVGWIGMVLVDEDHRRRGYATRIFTHAVDAARERGITAFGLDATDAGRGVYSNLAFADVAPIARWGGTLSPPGDPADPAVTALRSADADEVSAYDAKACGADRRRFLDLLRSEPRVRGFVSRREGDLRGYVLRRPGRDHWHVGPLVADDAATGRALLSAVASDLAGESAVADLFDGPEIERITRDHGLVQRRRLTRMTHGGARPLLMGDRVIAAAGFEWG